jgi:hypothetical protein
MNSEGEFKSTNEEEAIQKIQYYLVKPIEAIVERFKVIRELKNKHPIIWNKLSQNEDYDEDFRREIQSFFFNL